MTQPVPPPKTCLTKRICVTKRFTFSYAHCLINHPGKCANMHGHNAVLEVSLEGYPSCDTGMIIDFHDITTLVHRLVIDKYDHQNLNSYFLHPTCENVALDIFESIHKYLLTYHTDIRLTKIRLSETEDSWVEVTNV